MRYDDALQTVLADDSESGIGAEAAWRQIVDLLGRRRAPPSDVALARLASLTSRVPLAVRAASARQIEGCNPPFALVQLLARDALPVAMPVLRSATLADDEWVALIGEISPAGRMILRGRRDLGPLATRALDAFGPTDLVLGDDRVEAVAAEPEPIPTPLVTEPTADFVRVGDLAMGMPVVAEAVRRAGETEAGQPSAPSGDGTFRIADIVARIETHRRKREAPGEPDTAAAPRAAPDRFRFETDATGIVRQVEGVARGPLIGLDLSRPGADTGCDAIPAGALRRRAPFHDARLTVRGTSDAGGEWRLSAVPVFDGPTGRFTGFRGSARRPRPDERAGRASAASHAQRTDTVRQLVHELRTPANAISGFAELIDSQMIGPVAQPYRERAAQIREQARLLLAAIDDLELAARIEGDRLELRPQAVALAPLLDGIAGDLAPLAELRGVAIGLPAVDAALQGDARAIERMFSRLMATLVASGGQGERIGIAVTREDAQVVIAIDRPARLAIDEAELAGDEEPEDGLLLGTGFAMRLVANLAQQLGGALSIDAERLTLRLPAADGAQMEQARNGAS